MRLFLFLMLSWAGTKTYTDVNSVEAERVMRAIASKPYESLTTEADQVEWVKARLAWIALARLRGQEKFAKELFVGCKSFCKKHAPEKEWASLVKWSGKN